MRGLSLHIRLTAGPSPKTNCCWDKTSPCQELSVFGQFGQIEFILWRLDRQHRINVGSFNEIRREKNKINILKP